MDAYYLTYELSLVLLLSALVFYLSEPLNMTMSVEEMFLAAHSFCTELGREESLDQYTLF